MRASDKSRTGLQARSAVGAAKKKGPGDPFYVRLPHRNPFPPAPGRLKLGKWGGLWSGNYPPLPTINLLSLPEIQASDGRGIGAGGTPAVRQRT